MYCVVVCIFSCEEAALEVQKEVCLCLCLQNWISQGMYRDGHYNLEECNAEYVWGQTLQVEGVDEGEEKDVGSLLLVRIQLGLPAAILLSVVTRINADVIMMLWVVHEVALMHDQPHQLLHVVQPLSHQFRRFQPSFQKYPTYGLVLSRRIFINFMYPNYYYEFISGSFADCVYW